MQYTADITSEEIEERYNKLPKPIREYIDAPVFANTVREVASHYDLHIDTTEKLREQTLLALLGIIKMDDFGDSLVDNLNLDKKVAGDLVSEINDLIFKDARDILKQATTKTSQETRANEPTPVEPPAEESSKEETETEEPAVPHVDITRDKLSNTKTLAPEEKIVGDDLLGTPPTPKAGDPGYAQGEDPYLEKPE